MVFTSCCILNNKQIVPTRLEEMNALSHSFDRLQIGGRESVHGFRVRGNIPALPRRRSCILWIITLVCEFL